MRHILEDTLEIGEPHPIAGSAFDWIKKNFNVIELMSLVEPFASTAMSGNRLAEICLGTLNRILANEPVSDRYVLGLAWFLRERFPKPVKINLNAKIRVRINDIGKAVLRKKDYYDKHKIKEDNEGYSIWPLWEIMTIFNSELYVGSRPVFVDNEIILVDKDDKIFL